MHTRRCALLCCPCSTLLLCSSCDFIAGFRLTTHLLVLHVSFAHTCFPIRVPRCQVNGAYMLGHPRFLQAPDLKLECARPELEWIVRPMLDPVHAFSAWYLLCPLRGSGLQVLGAVMRVGPSGLPAELAEAPATSRGIGPA